MDIDPVICTVTFYGRLVDPLPLGADRWGVVWWAPERHEAYFSDKARAEAYAALKRGVVVPMAALTKWPSTPNGSHQQAG